MLYYFNQSLLREKEEKRKKGEGKGKKEIKISDSPLLELSSTPLRI